MAVQKRASVLVTDSRSRPSSSSSPSSSALPSRSHTNPPLRSQTISIDNLLPNSSDIPSAQARAPPVRSKSVDGAVATPGTSSTNNSAANPNSARRRQVASNPANLAFLQSRLAQHGPSRSSKVSEKLVLIPEAGPSAEEVSEAQDFLVKSLQRKDGERPLRDEELKALRQQAAAAAPGRSLAEWLPKPQRSENLARLTAYCTAQAFQLNHVADFLRKTHDSKTKLYDDCLYVIYSLPLLSGTDGYRVRSRPILRTPGSAKTVFDLAIERGERSDHHYEEEYEGRPNDEVSGASHREGGHRREDNASSSSSSSNNGNNDTNNNNNNNDRDRYQEDSGDANSQHGHEINDTFSRDSHRAPPSSSHDAAEPGILPERLGPFNPLVPEVNNYAELFVFDYGVVVFWNFTEHQERDILADLTFANKESPKPIGYPLGPTSVDVTDDDDDGHDNDVKDSDSSSSHGSAGRLPLITRPFDEDSVETEEFHFQYSQEAKRPRIFNDVITLLPASDHMIKLTISHAIAQSTKLCSFEERMSQTMTGAHGIPRNLALTGQLDMSREEVVQLLGQIFTNRVDINLSSSVLETPKFFWDSEPTLNPLYVAIREYLEIDNRINVLNEQCRVFLDLAEILSDSAADSKMSYLTWIIIILIVVSIGVTVSEVFIRLAIVAKPARDSPIVGAPSNLANQTALPGLDRMDALREYLHSVPYELLLDEVRKRALDEEL